MSSEHPAIGGGASGRDDEQYAIRVRAIGKRYRIGERPGLKNAREALSDAAKRIARRSQRADAPSRDFWALRDVSFDIERGEIIGIIGANGAGKSTLLKVLSRITAPTTGSADLYGRVGALLEVGAGFSNELTGRENMYLNGAILGMKKWEINERFDEIVEFAGVGDYLDTPVKRYSSGMYTRLAFAVAAHLETEILFIDEVLSVGDQKFQEKSLGKMRDVATSGKTVLFVSHNMAAVTSLCTRALLIHSGSVTESGPTQDVIDAYLKLGKEASSTPLTDRLDRRGDGSVVYTALGLEDDEGNALSAATSGRPVTIRLDYASKDDKPIHHVVVGIYVRGLYGQPLFLCLSRVAQEDFSSLAPTGSIRCTIPMLPLLPGVYMMDVWFKVNETITDFINHASELTVSEGDFFGSGKLPPKMGGEFLVYHEWSATEAE